MKTLDLGYNRLTGAIPTELGGLSSLEKLYLRHNRLTGSIPTQLGNISTLESLFLNSNKLTGSVPAELGQLSSLNTPLIHNNDLTGCIPTAVNTSEVDADELAAWSGLPWCKADGSAPEPVNLKAECKKAVAKTIRSPALLADCVTLFNTKQRLLEHASGSDTLNWATSVPISDWEGITVGGSGKESRVTKVQLAGKRLNVIPWRLGNLDALTHLELNGSQLEGHIPQQLGRLSNLTHLKLNSNSLYGEIPPQLGRLSNLTVLQLDGNELKGCIPVSIRNLSSLGETAINGLPGSLGMAWCE